MATTRQIEFFDNLLNEKDFSDSGKSVDELRDTFADLSRKAASDWIEKAIQLDDVGAEEGDATPPPF